ncbi:hypothetical protein ACWN8B_08660 [Vagococcus zengguangii]|uniref:Uncharacterized protein n=1 Tax=Vagococcus zengguangii TaxID=2571750 RepID=A0A4D7CRN2_9ENTE|nr:hypothetical protein [Vagococcus zengguangii]QCI86748.1 hypothetical protein FA707_07110 [Vagococcus zengguangii]
MKKHTPKSVFEIISSGVKIPSLIEVELGVKLGRWLVEYLDETPESIDIYRTPLTQRVPDFALAAGVLQFEADHPNIHEAFQLAYQAGIEVAFINAVSTNDDGLNQNWAKLRVTSAAQIYRISYQLLEDYLVIVSINDQLLNLTVK